MKHHRPWGSYEILLDEENCKVKKIIVNPAGKLSYQYHHKRSEVWTIISGTGALTLDDDMSFASAGRVIRIDQGQKHRIENTGQEDLVFIEVQTGTYFGEDDIVRLEDVYGRAHQA